MMRKGILAGCLFAFAVAAAGQVSGNGSQFQVNTETFSYQGLPEVAVDGLGGFVVVWQSWYYVTPEAHDSLIEAQRYAASGAPVGGEFQIDTDTSSSAGTPSLAAGGDGSFVVVWKEVTPTGPFTSVGSIQGRRYDTHGLPADGPFQINSSTTTWMGSPAIAMAAPGGFVVAWQHYGSGGTDSDEYSIQARRYDENGLPIGGQFQVNTYTPGRQVYPALSTDSTGRFVVVWQSAGSSGTDSDGYSIQARRYDPDGLPLGDQFQVNAYTTGGQALPAVAVDGQGRFLVAWTSGGSPGTDSSLSSVQARRFDSGGVPIGEQFQVNTYTTDSQERPAAAVDGRGDFVLTWESGGSSGGDSSERSVHARRFRASGAPLGDEFQVNTYTTGRQYRAAVAAEGSGNFVVVWESDGSSGSDLDRDSVQGQRFDDLFRDGFGFGNTSRWSLTVP